MYGPPPPVSHCLNLLDTLFIKYICTKHMTSCALSPMSWRIPSYLPTFILTLLITTAMVLYIFHVIKQSTTTFIHNIEQFSMNPTNHYHNGDQAAWDEKLPVEFKGLAQHYVSMQIRIRELIKELTVSARVAALGDMVAVIAHDIRNPLAVIKSNAEMGALSGDREKQQNYFKKIITTSDKMNEMLNRFMLLVRSPSETRERLDLHKLLDELSTLMGTLAAKKEIGLVCDSAPNLPQVEGDRVGLSQALMNILNNAIEATPPGGRVTLSACELQNSVEISIADTGGGIPEDQQEKIFERFFTTKGKGTGIGLALAHSVITKHGGKIWLNSMPGQGTTFYVKLPATPGEIKSNKWDAS